MASKIKKGDTVIVLTGRDKGRSGEVLKVLPTDNRVLVDGVNMVKKHKKASPTSAGGIETMAAPLHISNVAHKDPRSGKATRIGFKILEDGRKVRFAKASGEVIDR
ncbi:MAG: rplX [Rhodospirillales bacterium]|jgi:large subunit ribosomal protein L24|nr:rplX [Rhodospirillales bacterium]